MIETILELADKDISIDINMKKLSIEQLEELHLKIRTGKNTLLNRTLFFLLSGIFHNEDCTKEIEIDINTSMNDPNYVLISDLFIKAFKQKEIVSKSKKITNTKLSKKEQILLNALQKACYDRQQLILIIYGEDCDYLKAETSFKSLLYRFKKKLSGEIIVSVDGIYSIAT